MAKTEFQKQLEGYGLTTANICYRLPDHPAILQNYIWQEYDVHPHYPELKRFLDFWSAKLEGAIHSVVVAHQGLIRPAELRMVGREFSLN